MKDRTHENSMVDQTRLTGPLGMDFSERSKGNEAEERGNPRAAASGKRPSSRGGLLVFLAAALVASGCAKSTIPNTDVEDTSENRRVLKFCEEYRHAVEERDITTLLKLASPQYYEDGGNANGNDDLDYEGLKEYLVSTFSKANAIRYEIRYRKISMTEKKRILVEYTYSGSYKIPGLKNDEWKHTVADNRLELVATGDTFKIMAGM